MSEVEVVVRPPIGALIREGIETATDDLSDAIDRIMSLIDPSDYEAYLRELLSSRLSSEVGYMRRKNTPTPVRQGLSTKVALIRDQYWPQFLQQRIATASGYKVLADATVDDLRFVAGVRRTQASDLLAQARQFEDLASLMERARVKRLAQLDPKLGTRVVERAA